MCSSDLNSEFASAWDGILPDSGRTPGAVLTTDLTTICQRGYARTVRHTPRRVKRRVWAAYSMRPDEPGYQFDHLIPLELGGADVEENLWPQSYGATPWNARLKDNLENRLRREVCEGRMPLDLAQQLIARDWIAAYEKVFGSPAEGNLRQNEFNCLHHGGDTGGLP